MGEKMNEIFKYDTKNSYFNNFYNWWSINSEEKRRLNKETYQTDDAIKAFDNLYGYHNK
jgi:hypothetical protein